MGSFHSTLSRKPRSNTFSAPQETTFYTRSTRAYSEGGRGAENLAESSSNSQTSPLEETSVLSQEKEEVSEGGREGNNDTWREESEGRDGRSVEGSEDNEGNINKESERNEDNEHEGSEDKEREGNKDKGRERNEDNERQGNEDNERERNEDNERERNEDNEPERNEDNEPERNEDNEPERNEDNERERNEDNERERNEDNEPERNEDNERERNEDNERERNEDNEHERNEDNERQGNGDNERERTEDNEYEGSEDKEREGNIDKGRERNEDNERERNEDNERQGNEEKEHERNEDHECQGKKDNETKKEPVEGVTPAGDMAIYDLEGKVEQEVGKSKLEKSEVENKDIEKDEPTVDVEGSISSIEEELIGIDVTDLGRDVDIDKIEREMDIYFARGVDSDDTGSDTDMDFVEIVAGTDTYVAATDINLHIINEEEDTEEEEGIDTNDGERHTRIDQDKEVDTGKVEEKVDDAGEIFFVRDDTKENTEYKSYDSPDTGGATREAVKEVVHTVTEAVTEAVTEVVKSVRFKEDTNATESDVIGLTHEAVKEAVHTAAAPVFPAMLLRESSPSEAAEEERKAMQFTAEEIRLLTEDMHQLLNIFEDPQNSGEESSPSVIEHVEDEDNDSELMRLVKMVVVDAAAVVRIVLAWVLPEKTHLQRYDHFLLRDKKMNRASFRSVFSKQQRDNLQSDPSGVTFDLNLLCLLLEHVTDKLALSGDDLWFQPSDHLEYQLTAMREFRANVFCAGEITHQELIDKAMALENFLKKILEAAGRVCQIDLEIVNQKIQEMSQSIKRTMYDRKVQWNVSDYGEAVLCEEKSQLLVLKASTQLRSLYDRRTCPGLVPVKELNQHLKLETIFTDINIAETDRDGNFKRVTFEDMLEVHNTHHSTEGRDTSRVILVKGPSGFGKTTVVRKIISNWSKKANLPRGLACYDLLIHLDCKNPCLKSFSELLNSLMPDARKMFTDGDVVKCLRSTKTLVVVDSLDDMNMSSLQVVREIISAAKSSTNMTVFITSTPEAVEDLYKFISHDLPTFNLNILGVSKKNRGIFAKRLYKGIMENTQDVHSRGLESFFDKTPRHLQDYWRCPLNIALLVSLWAISPEEAMSLTSVTNLLVRIDEMCQRNLLSTLQENPSTKHYSNSELKDKMRVFFLWFCNEALLGMKRTGGNLAGESLKRLKHACQSVGLPTAKVINNFLIKDTILTPTGEQTIYNFPHKKIQEFYAALAILNRLLEKENEVDLTKVLCDLHTVLASHNVSATRTQDILRYTHGVLSEAWEPHKRGIMGKLNTTVFSSRENTIMNILREGCHPTPTLPIWRFQNVFAFLFGFVSLLKEDTKQETVKELALLLERSGLRDKEMWLDILENSGCDSCVGREMARCVPDVLDLDGNIHIRDSRVATYTTLMKYARPSKVTVNIIHDPREIPSFLELMLSLCRRPCEIQLLLKHDFLHPKVLSSQQDVTIQHVFQWCRVVRFEGQVTPATGLVLPTSLTHLSLSFLDAAHYCSLAPILDTLLARLQDLNSLAVLIGSDMVPEALHALPRVPSVHLFLGDVSKATLAWACECARQLEPENGFDTLSFPGANLNPSDTELLQSLLSAAGVTAPGGVTVMCTDGQTLILECVKQSDEVHERI